MSPQSNLSLCRAFLQTVVNQGEIALAEHFIAADSIHHELGAVAPECRGPQAMADFVELYRWAFPDLHLRIDDMVASGDRVVTRWRLEGTQDGPLMGIAPSGRRVSVEGIRIDRIEGGKIAESWVQWDVLGMLEQIGALPKLRRLPLHEAVPADAELAA
jgi:steroid delta-isomerase-like uncharacterized protein